jgi:hypothetical protein
MSPNTGALSGDEIVGTVAAAPKRAIAARMSWGLADQAVSSLSNFAVGLVVARALGAVDFGIFALAWATYASAARRPPCGDRRSPRRPAPPW